MPSKATCVKQEQTGFTSTLAGGAVLEYSANSASSVHAD